MLYFAARRSRFLTVNWPTNDAYGAGSTNVGPPVPCRRQRTFRKSSAPTAEEAKRRMDIGEAVVFLDSRADDAWRQAEAQIPNSRQVPPDGVEAHLDEIPRRGLIVPYCTSTPAPVWRGYCCNTVEPTCVRSLVASTRGERRAIPPKPSRRGHSRSARSRRTCARLRATTTAASRLMMFEIVEEVWPSSHGT